VLNAVRDVDGIRIRIAWNGGTAIAPAFRGQGNATSKFAGTKGAYRHFGSDCGQRKGKKLV
jgi:hypothetical protein